MPTPESPSKTLAPRRAIGSNLVVEQVPIDRLRPDPANPRHIPLVELEALTRSMAEFGFVDPVIARREDGMLIGGHQRLVAAHRLGLDTIPVIYLDLSAQKAQLLGLALNRIAGSWDEELLAQLLKSIGDDPGIDLTVSGFADDEIRSLLKNLETREKRDQSERFDLDAGLRSAYENPRARRGELFLLGEHRLLCGDATDAEDMERLLAGSQANMAFTDPPYGVSLGDHGGRQKGQSRRRLKNDSLSAEDFKSFSQAWIDNLLRSVEGALYIFTGSKELHRVSTWLEDAGAHWSDTLIWRKDRFVLGRAPYQRIYEPCWFGWPQGVKPYWSGGRKQADVWDIPRPDENPLHPTQKPITLIEKAIQNSSRARDVVLDLFLGSGSTIIACERTGRMCFGLELDEHYASLAVARWEAFTGLKAQKVRQR